MRAAELAYCPYSQLKAGAAALCDDGRTVTGCNVANAPYGLSLCAECTMAGQLRYRVAAGWWPSPAGRVPGGHHARHPPDA